MLDRKSDAQSLLIEHEAILRSYRGIRRFLIYLTQPIPENMPERSEALDNGLHLIIRDYLNDPEDQPAAEFFILSNMCDFAADLREEEYKRQNIRKFRIV